MKTEIRIKKSKILSTQGFTTLALILLMTLSAFFFLNPISADDAPTYPYELLSAEDIPTYSYLNVQPNPIGVGQTWLVTWQIDKVPPVFLNGSVTGEYWSNVTIKIQLPDGTMEEKGGLTASPIGGNLIFYTPTQTGNYTFWMEFPGQQLIRATNNTYLPSSSAKIIGVVQEQPIPDYPAAPLPEDYWQRPITALNREWSVLGGNWLNVDSNQVNLYTAGPETAHIVWTKAAGMPGGIIGGDHGSESNYAGLWYYARFLNPIVIEGRLYYRTISGEFDYQGTACVDIRTGEEIWNKPGVFLTNGQIYYQDIGDIHGGIPLLWSTTGSTWKIYSALTGDFVCDLPNATSGTMVTGPNGELLVYFFNTDRTNLLRWNSSEVDGFIAYNTGMWQWTPSIGSVVDWQTGIDRNWTIPNAPGQRIAAVSDGVIYARTTFRTDNTEVILQDIGYNQETGNVLWGPVNRTVQPSVSVKGTAEGVLVESVSEKFELHAYDLKTGNQIWTSYTNKLPNDYYNTDGGIAYGKFFLGSYSGHVSAYDLKTGKMVWDWYSGSSGFETPTGSWQAYGRFIVADGKLYVPCGDIEPFTPNWRGYPFVCLNATTGEELWRIKAEICTQNSDNNKLAIADGYLVGFNMYDNLIYSFGKGQTATTISASPKVLTNDNSVLLEGTVTDQSPGQTCLGIPAAGTPAIADEYMTPWMEYLYMQQPKPLNATGVEVTLATVDPNGNYRTIGTTTSDSAGLYKMLWQPDIPGEYTIIASFAGSESYWASSAQTAIGVTELATPTPQPTQPASMADLYLVPGIISVIIAIIVVGVVIILALRKRP